MTTTATRRRSMYAPIRWLHCTQCDVEWTDDDHPSCWCCGGVGKEGHLPALVRTGGTKTVMYSRGMESEPPL